MKYILLLFLSFSISGQILARCAPSGLWAFPTQEINQNGIIILEGFGRSQTIIKTLQSDYPIYLQADSHRVNLVVDEVCEGMYSITQAILHPEKQFIPGKTYLLVIKDIHESELKRWNRETSQYEPISWTVREEGDYAIPNWETKPRLIEKTSSWYGCGPARFAIFDLEIEDESKVMIKTELVDLTSDATNTLYLTLDETCNLKVGHGMCGGAFNYLENHQYKIRFSLTDFSGNTDNIWTEWTNFDSPYQT